MHLLLPLLSGMLYVVAALFLKQASGHQVGVWRITFLCNWITALLFLTLLPLGGQIPLGKPFWQPAIVALFFVVGQISTFFALERGDVSVATPVMGAKVLLVAIFSTFLLQSTVAPQLWVAAALSSLGVAFINRRGESTKHHHVGRTIFFALQAAVAYAMFDILVIKWAPAWGPGRFLPIMMLLAGCYSLIFIPMFRQPLRAISRPAWRVILLGGIFIASQAIILITTLAVFGDATAVNVVYCMRGLWSVLAVWWIGHWFGNTEGALGNGILGWRLLGALLLSAAVVLVFI